MQQPLRQRLLAHRHLPWLLGFLAFVLTLPALGNGLKLDDYFHRGRMLGLGPFPPMEHPLLQYYSMVTAGEGPYDIALRKVLAWWAAPDLEITFFRPLSIATHVLDYGLWPANFVLQHLHSLLWYALAVAAATWACRQISASPVVGGLIGLLFAVEDSHGMPAGWLANRNSLVTLALGCLALGLHVRWRKGRGTIHGVLAPVALATALLGGESGVGVAAYLFAWEVFLARDPLRRRIIAFLPTLGVVAAWRVLYVGLGYRTWGSGLYIDPGRQPLEFARAALERGPVLLLSQWTQVQVDLMLAFPRSLQLALSGLGLVLVAAILSIFWRTLREDAEARFWALGMTLALVPVCATFPMDRLLTFVGIGAFGLLAVQVGRLGWLGDPVRTARGRLIKIATLLLLVLHLVMAPPLLSVRAMFPRLIYGIVEKSVGCVPPDAPIQHELWVVVNGFDIFSMYMGLIRGVTGQTVPEQVELLSCMLADLDIHRPDERTLEVRPANGFLAHDIERLVRAADIPFEAGQVIPRDRMEVEIVEVTPEGRPALVRFRFDVPLEDPSIRWFQAEGIAGSPWVPPAVGTTMHLPGISVGLGGI